MYITTLALVLALAVTEPSSALFSRDDGGPVHLQLTPPPEVPVSVEHAAQQIARRREILYGQNRRQSAAPDVPTPPQEFDLVVDTGSAWTWVWDSSSTPTTCGNHTGGFDASKSSTYLLNDTLNNPPYGPVPVVFVSSYCRGTWGQDTVGLTNGLGVAAGSMATASNFVFKGNTTSQTWEPPGLLGFAFQTPGLPRPFWYELLNTWRDRRFSIFLGNVNQNTTTPIVGRNGGVLTLGGVNTDLFTGNINYVPLSQRFYRQGQPGFWEVAVTGAEHGGKVFGNNTVAVLDTGSPVSWVPQDLFTAVYSGLTGVQQIKDQDGQAPHYLFPCSSASQLTDITFAVGGEKYTIPGTALSSYDHDDGSTAMCSSLLVPNQQQPSPSGAPPGSTPEDWLLGDGFLRSVYTVYQWSPPAVGFAKLSQKALTSTPSIVNPSPDGAAATGSATGSATATPSKAPSGASRTMVNLCVVILSLMVAACILHPVV
ncbi:Pregnancy-associated glycoprotein [Vanrija pseudolonga]|uniref:Pregnancy-associated glycoprotein n=1 Tax=Vanrija pseudolonga TaxID=143232 RepID=A0AAF0YDN9_9TREE|nr:Pregnancy-associated glycoprotein [Vanrija pseudolonga]